MVPPVYQELVFEVLGGMEILAGRLLPVTASLNTVVARSHSSILHLHVWRRMCKLALSI